MSGATVVVDDRHDVNSSGGVPRVVYNPSNLWVNGAHCGGCTVGKDAAALDLLQRSARNGTWTVAGADRSRRNISATLNFQGTNISVYFIVFHRSLEPRTWTGPSNLTFSIDGTVRSVVPLRPGDFNGVFNSYNFTPPTRLFQMSGLDSGAVHTLQAEWAHEGTPRPQLAVALDYIEFDTDVPTLTAPQSNRVVKIVVGTVVPLVVIIALLVGFFLWRRRRRRPKPPEDFDLLQGTRGRDQVEPSGPRRIWDPYVSQDTTMSQSEILTYPASLNLAPSDALQPPTYSESLRSEGTSPIGGSFAPIVKNRHR